MTMTIPRKLGLLLLLAALSTLAMTAVQFLTLKSEMLSERQQLLRSQVESAISIVSSLDAAAKTGKMSQDAAKARAAETLGAISYGAKDYVFVHDSKGTMIVHPNAKLIGQSLWTKADSNGVLLFQELAARAAEGGGFTPYFWPRPGSEADVPKLSYSQRFADWDWVVGTGVYMDDMDAVFVNELYKAAGCAALLLTLLGLCVWPIARSITRPLSGLEKAMLALSAGRKDIAVPYVNQGDEVGKMARSVEGFRLAAVEAERVAAEAASLRGDQEGERSRQLEAEHAKAEALDVFVGEIGQGFERLSRGDLTVRLDRPVAPEYEAIRDKFNVSVEALEDAISAVVGGIGAISTGLNEITVASNDLSQRTEQQAASLEETVAALSEVTRGVNETAESAGRAQTTVAKAQQNAEKGGAIVGRAVDAMNQIAESSDKIGKIIGVIDEIAFQTNLLALNAGVEAARAGEAGRGFAVVAQEVRGLAQRSAEAAKEIKSLISLSSQQVGHGVELVTASGRSLSEIVDEVSKMSEVVIEIARSAKEQATSLREVSTAADQMDKVTQQNAAMVEETTAAAQTLTTETETLSGLVSSFTVTKAQNHAVRGPSRPSARSSRPASSSPQRPAVQQMRTTGSGGAARKPQPSAESWEEF